MYRLISILIGAACGLAMGALLYLADLYSNYLAPAAIGGLLGAVWGIAFGPPGSRSGLTRKARYKVTRAFKAGRHEFDAGEMLVFVRERRFIPDEYEPASDHDLYGFILKPGGEK